MDDSATVVGSGDRFMASPLRRETSLPAAEIIRHLETARRRPDAVLREAVGQADAIAAAVIPLVEDAADGVYLLPKQQNLLFWGIHVLAAARWIALYRPLLRMVRALDEYELEALIGDAATETLARVVLSVFDGDPAPLLEGCEDRQADGYSRWGLMNALARLTFDGVVPRAIAIAFFGRFERESLAEPDDPAWKGWEECILLLGLDEMRERVRATWADGRNPDREIEHADWDQQLTLASSLAPGDPSLFDQYGHSAIDDPVEALGWIEPHAPSKEEDDNKDDGTDTNDPLGPDPAAEFALQDHEIEWLVGFLRSRHVPPDTMTLEHIDGFLCAVTLERNRVPLRKVLDTIWGDEEGPIFGSTEQAEFVIGLLTRHWSTIRARLAGRYPHFPCLLRLPGVARGKLWSQGFVAGMRESRRAWEARNADDDLRIGLGPMIILSLDDGDDFDGKPMTAETREQAISMIPVALLALYRAIREAPEDWVPQPNMPIRSTKVGRNEPCPCGSGKKYKRCCGASDRQAHN
jgi:yecA family protein